jgi:hypothetical protein
MCMCAYSAHAPCRTMSVLLTFGISTTTGIGYWLWALGLGPTPPSSLLMLLRPAACRPAALLLTADAYTRGHAFEN